MTAGTLLVSGSRNIGMIHPDPLTDSEFYVNIIDRALANGWHIIAGDAKGVDHYLAYAATHNKFRDLAPLMTVYGVQDKPRHGIQNAQVIYANIAGRCEASTAMKRYQLRDDFMLSQADYVYCIVSKKNVKAEKVSGAERVHDLAISFGKTAWLKVVA